MVMFAKEIDLVTLDIILNSLVFLFVHGTKDIVNFRITKFHMCISANDILYTVRQVSVKQCTEECASLPDCSAVNYRRFSKLCELHSTFQENFMDNAFTEGPCDFIIRSDIFSQKSQLDCSHCANDGNSNTKCCDRTYCPNLKLEDGTLLGNMHSVGSRVEYTCNKNFVETDGETHSTCQTNGSWTHEPTCTKKGSCRRTNQCQQLITKNLIYLGCHEDRSQRILYDEYMRSSFLTTDMCVNFCFDLGYKYASTQYTSECYCGNTVRDYPKVDESECNMPCAGDPTEICGGAWRGSLYKRMQ